MKEQLLSLGWVMYYECVTPCAKQYFTNAKFPGYEIRVRTRKRSFNIILNNQIIAGTFQFTQLVEKLKKYGIYE